VYAAAVEQLSPAALPEGPSARTLAVLGAVERAYEQLAAAATSKQRPRYGAAVASVRAAEQRLRQDLQGLELRLREAASGPPGADAS
jgi:hypothetical protein